jgi:hypothetical protein
MSRSKGRPMKAAELRQLQKQRQFTKRVRGAESRMQRYYARKMRGAVIMVLGLLAVGVGLGARSISQQPPGAGSCHRHLWRGQLAAALARPGEGAGGRFAYSGLSL